MKFFRLVLILSVFLCSSVFADNQKTFTPTQQKAIEDIVHNYLVQHPQVLMEASDALQKQQYNDMKQKNIDAAKKYTAQLFRDPKDIVMGNPNGKITLVEFFDYQCPFCRQMGSDITAVMKEYPDLRVVFKDLPVHGDNSVLAAVAAYAAKQQGKYMEFHDAILTGNQMISEQMLMQTAKKLGLNMPQFSADMEKYKKPMMQQMQDTTKFAVNDLKLIGTPAFFAAKTDADATSDIEVLPGGGTKDALDAMIKKVQ